MPDTSTAVGLVFLGRVDDKAAEKRALLREDSDVATGHQGQHPLTLLGTPDGEVASHSGVVHGDLALSVDPVVWVQPLIEQDAALGVSPMADIS